MPSTKELIYSETDGSCAYCGIKDYRILTIHHIVQQEPKDESYGNKVLLCYNCHTLHHQKNEPTKEDLITIKKRLIQKILTPQGVNALKEVYRNGRIITTPYIVTHLVEMELIEYVEDIAFQGTSSGNKIVMDALYSITNEGKHFVAKWKLG